MSKMVYFTKINNNIKSKIYKITIKINNKFDLLKKIPLIIE